MKSKIITLIFGIALLIGVVSCLNTPATVTTVPKAQPEFKLTAEQMALDLQNRYVILPPAGQLWAFNPDQKVTVTVLQTKYADDVVIVAVKLSTTAQVQPPAAPKDKTAIAAPEKPVTVTLSGVAKISYELIANEWYLLDVVSVNLRANQ